MKNPIKKRIPRELKKEWGKYIAIFLFMTMLISLVSGFLVADNSMISAYNEGFTKYNIEDGHISFDKEMDEELAKILADKAGLTFYDMDYIEQEIEETGANLRVYVDREDVNLECVMAGEMPDTDNEIAIDRMFADNNNLKTGDYITLNGNKYEIVGLVALPDYSCLFESNSDMMFDSMNFCVGIMTEEGLKSVRSGHYVYNYAWKYDNAPADDIEAKEKSDDFLDIIEDEITAYDKVIIQRQVDELVAKLEDAAEEMSTEFEKISEELELKIKLAAEEVVKEKIISGIPEEEITLSEDELADKLGVDRSTYRGLMEKLENLENSNVEFEHVNVDEMNLEEDGDEVFDSSELDNIKEVINLLDKSGLCDVTVVSKALNEIDEILEKGIDKEEILEIEDYLPRYLNQAINFTGEDMGKDKAMFIVFDYIVIVILAFVFGVTTLNTIAQESSVIGTLRASGYTKGELLRHYMALPVIVTFVAAIIGNILGYTCMKNIMTDMYYNSYSLCTYVTLWNMEAFIDTTVIPLILMLVINYLIIVSKLKLSPLRFLRRDISKRRKKKAVKLNTKIPFIHRFRLRILFQNVPAYVTLFAGIFFAGFVAVFGFMFKPLFVDYADLVIESKIASYQYVLKEAEETESEKAEKYCIDSLETMDEKYMKDTVSIYGIEEDSQYINMSIEEGKALINNGLAIKYGLEKGDVITLKDPYSSKTYSFEIGGIYTYDAAISVFMNRAEFNEMFGKKEDYFTGYFSNEKLNDLDSENIYSVVTDDDLLKISNQLIHSMGGFMNILTYFAVAMFLLLMFILTKMIIEKNAVSISMIKILGFTGGEIGGLYLVCTSLVVLASLFVMVPIINCAMKYVFENMLYKMMGGYIPFLISGSCYTKTIIMGILCYVFVCIFLMKKINNIPKTDALKMVE